MSTFETKSNAISSLLSAIRDGNIAIPEIQRPFVRNSIKVRDLMDSMYRGYPIGFIITWKNADIRLKDGTIAAGKSIIIDGQQRITTVSLLLLAVRNYVLEHSDLNVKSINTEKIKNAYLTDEYADNEKN